MRILLCFFLFYGSIAHADPLLGKSSAYVISDLGELRDFQIDKVEPSAEVRLLTLDNGSTYRPSIDCGFVIESRDGTILQIDFIAASGQTISTVLAKKIMENEAPKWVSTGTSKTGARLYRSEDSTRFAAYTEKSLNIWTDLRQRQHSTNPVHVPW